MKRVFLIRHGESESNAGGRTKAPHATGITAHGEGQAKRLAEKWDDESPNLIVTSPFIRTKLTATPFIARHPQVLHEEWPVQEFTQLSPRDWLDTTHEERMPKVREYWERADPHYRDGLGAESFADFIGRVEDMLDLAATSHHDTIVIFTHGTLMQATMWTILFDYNERPTGESMRRFLRFAEIVPIDNTGVISLTRHDKTWTVGAVKPAA